MAAADEGTRPAAQTREADADAGLALSRALLLTLANDPNIALVERAVDGAEGARLATLGAFDPELQAALDAQEQRDPLAGGERLESRLLDASATLSQTLRNGLTLAPSVTLARTGATPDSNLATVAFLIRQPLLRGRGRAVVGAESRAAGRELEAARLELAHTVATRLAAVAERYWRLRAAMLDVEILRASTRRSEALRATTERLIEADMTPAAELIQLEADLASRRADVAAGERALFGARFELGREIGLTPDAIADLPLPADPFPELAPAALPGDGDDDGGAGNALIAVALAERADLRAERARAAAEAQRLLAAEDALDPRLDLLLESSYTGRVDDDDPAAIVRPLGSGIPGLSTLLGLRWTWPVRNRRAAGERLQAAAALDASRLRVERAAKSIGAAVPAALDAVRRGAEQVAALSTAVELFARTVENESKKLRAGSSTLLDVLTQRDRLRAAERQLVAARLALALALLDLRFETGTLIVAGDGWDGRVDPRRAITVPLPELPEPPEPRPEDPP